MEIDHLNDPNCELRSLKLMMSKHGVVLPSFFKSSITFEFKEVFNKYRSDLYPLSKFPLDEVIPLIKNDELRSILIKKLATLIKNEIVDSKKQILFKIADERQVIADNLYQSWKKISKYERLEILNGSSATLDKAYSVIEGVRQDLMDAGHDMIFDLDVYQSLDYMEEFGYDVKKLRRDINCYESLLENIVSLSAMDPRFTVELKIKRFNYRESEKNCEALASINDSYLRDQLNYQNMIKNEKVNREQEIAKMIDEDVMSKVLQKQTMEEESLKEKGQISISVLDTIDVTDQSALDQMFDKMNKKDITSDSINDFLNSSEFDFDSMITGSNDDHYYCDSDGEYCVSESEDISSSLNTEEFTINISDNSDDVEKLMSENHEYYNALNETNSKFDTYIKSDVKFMEKMERVEILKEKIEEKNKKFFFENFKKIQKVKKLKRKLRSRMRLFRRYIKMSRMARKIRVKVTICGVTYDKQTMIEIFGENYEKIIKLIRSNKSKARKEESDESDVYIEPSLKKVQLVKVIDEQFALFKLIIPEYYISRVLVYIRIFFEKEKSFGLVFYGRDLDTNDGERTIVETTTAHLRGFNMEISMTEGLIVLRVDSSCSLMKSIKRLMQHRGNSSISVDLKVHLILRSDFLIRF
jgi:hypothetical protein